MEIRIQAMLPKLVKIKIQIVFFEYPEACFYGSYSNFIRINISSVWRLLFLLSFQESAEDIYLRFVVSKYESRICKDKEKVCG